MRFTPSTLRNLLMMSCVVLGLSIGQVSQAQPRIKRSGKTSVKKARKGQKRKAPFANRRPQAQAKPCPKDTWFFDRKCRDIKWLRANLLNELQEGEFALGSPSRNFGWVILHADGKTYHIKGQRAPRTAKGANTKAQQMHRRSSTKKRPRTSRVVVPKSFIQGRYLIDRRLTSVRADPDTGKFGIKIEERVSSPRGHRWKHVRTHRFRPGREFPICLTSGQCTNYYAQCEQETIAMLRNAGNTALAAATAMIAWSATPASAGLTALPAHIQTGKAMYSGFRFVRSMEAHYQCVKRSKGGTGETETVKTDEPERGGEAEDDEAKQ